MNTHPREWTEKELHHLIGQPESSTLEFHESQFCAPGKNLLRRLSRDISGMANAEGGLILMGMRTTRGRPRQAVEIDGGIDPATLSLEQLSHLAEQSLSPHLSGIQCYAIPLSGHHTGRVAYLLSIPKGDRAYQANDYIYYTRNGFRNEALPDHMVRLLMLRGTTTTAALEVDNCEVFSKDGFDQYRFHPVVFNNSRHTIEDFLLEIRISVSDDALQLWAPTLFVENEEDIRNELKSVESMLEIGEDIDEYKRHEILQGPGIPFQSGDELRCSFRRIMQLLYQVDGKKIFPQDRLIFPGGKWLIDSIPQETPLDTYHPRLHWTIYLDNAPPCSGDIDLTEPFKRQQHLLEEFLV